MIAHRRKHSLLFEPIAAYDFQNKVDDRSGNNYALTLNNGATYTTDRNGNANSAALLDGFNDFANIDSLVTPLASTTQGTWVGWVKSTDVTVTQVIFGFSDTDSNPTILFFILGSKLRANGRDSPAVDWDVETDSIVFTNDTWHHVGIVHNETFPLLYFDGIAVDQTVTATDQTIWFNDCPTIDNGRIGNFSYSSGGESTHFDGSIDKVRIYDKALTAEQLYMIYSKG
jgi:hypothetical protein